MLVRVINYVATFVRTMGLLGLIWPAEDGVEVKNEKDVSPRPLPGPRALPLIGAAAQLGKHAKVWDGFMELNEIYGDIVGVQVGTRHCLLVSDADVMDEILVKRSHQFSNRPDFLRFHAIFRWDRNLCEYERKCKLK